MIGSSRHKASWNIGPCNA